MMSPWVRAEKFRKACSRLEGSSEEYQSTKLRDLHSFGIGDFEKMHRLCLELDELAFR